MKKLTSILLFVAVNLAMSSQTKPDKILNAFIDDFSEACGQDPGDVAFCLIDEKGNKITERYSIAMEANTWKVEPNDLVTENWTLNSKYKGKGAKLYCTKHPGGAGFIVYKVEFLNITTDALLESKVVTGAITLSKNGMANIVTVTTSKGNESYPLGNLDYYSFAKYLSPTNQLRSEYEGKQFVITLTKIGVNLGVSKLRLVNEEKVSYEKDNFTSATCRAYDVNGKLICIVENNTVYPIKNGVKQDKDAKPIQNKDEMCEKKNCIKVKLESDGIVGVYSLPNTTEKTSSLKIVGDRIYRVQKKTTEIDENREFYIYKGNKTQAALIAIATRMALGR